jgi:hypothetical protein
MKLVSEDPQCRNIFSAIIREGGKASGWALAKMLGEDPDALKTGIDKLRSARVLDSTGAGLEGYYYLTQLGFQLRSSVTGA